MLILSVEHIPFLITVPTFKLGIVLGIVYHIFILYWSIYKYYIYLGTYIYLYII